MLWRIQGRPLSIIGSVHRAVGPLSLTASMREALDNAATVAFECNFDQPPAASKFQFKGNGNLRVSIPADLYQLASRMWERLGAPTEDLDKLLPWAASMNLLGRELDRRGTIASHGLDLTFRKEARVQKKKLHFLEPADAWLRALGSGPRDEQLAGLSNCVLRIEAMVLRVNGLGSNWQDNDVDALERKLELWRSEQPVTAAAALDQRNRAWVDQLVRLSHKKDPVLVVVGALHMVGKNSLPELLSARGLTCNLA